MGKERPLGRSSSVPRYFFNVCCDDFETTDLVGEACANDVAALKGALECASAVIRQQLLYNRIPDGWIAVEDEQHREVMRLPLRAAAY